MSLDEELQGLDHTTRQTRRKFFLTDVQVLKIAIFRMQFRNNFNYAFMWFIYHTLHHTRIDYLELLIRKQHAFHWLFIAYVHCWGDDLASVLYWRCWNTLDTGVVCSNGQSRSVFYTHPVDQMTSAVAQPFVLAQAANMLKLASKCCTYKKKKTKCCMLICNVSTIIYVIYSIIRHNSFMYTNSHQ